MTTYHNVQVACAVCGQGSAQTVLGSTNRFGSPDLDLRPPEMERSTMAAWLQLCPSCGYCAPTLDKVTGPVAGILQDQDYRSALSDPAVPALARRFLCRGMILASLDDDAGAGANLLHAAWICDDEGVEAMAVDFRRRAGARLGRVVAQRAAKGADPAELELRMVDILRRCGLWDDARALCDTVVAGAGQPELVLVAQYQLQLIERRDIGVHKVEGAFGVQTPAGPVAAIAGRGPAPVPESRFRRAIARCLRALRGS